MKGSDVFQCRRKARPFIDRRSPSRVNRMIFSVTQLDLSKEEISQIGLLQFTIQCRLIFLVCEQNCGELRTSVLYQMST